MISFIYKYRLKGILITANPPKTPNIQNGNSLGQQPPVNKPISKFIIG